MGGHKVGGHKAAFISSARMGHRRWFHRFAGAIVVAGLAVFGACVDVDIPVEPELFPTGTSFVVSGRAAVINNDGPCPVWIGDNGVTYHLFQDPRVDNEDFDAVTTPGVASRLELAARSDLIVTCQVGTIVEVQDILELVE